jgi:hypothetical protein
MNSRQRFMAALQYDHPDRLPLLEEGVREEVRLAWVEQGLSTHANLQDVFGYDQREELELDLDPRPRLRRWPGSHKELGAFAKRLDSRISQRMPAGWPERISAWRSSTDILILRVQRGFFLSMGVEDWQRFDLVLELTKDDPGFVRDLLLLQGELAARLAEKVLQAVSIDAALFSEPIGGNHGPLISPKMYAELVLPAYQPILDVLRRYQVKMVIARTYANPRPLLPLLMQAGINCLWAVEPPPDTMDYLLLRQEFGRDLRLIGGIDADVLHQGKPAIRCAVDRVADLSLQGGYIPLLDGRVRQDVPYQEYQYYRQQLSNIIHV